MVVAVKEKTAVSRTCCPARKKAAIVANPRGRHGQAQAAAKEKLLRRRYVVRSHNRAFP